MDAISLKDAPVRALKPGTLNVEPFNPGSNKFIQVFNAITKRFIIANIHTEPAAGAVRCVYKFRLPQVDGGIQNMGNQTDGLTSFTVRAIFFVPFYSQGRQQSDKLVGNTHRTQIAAPGPAAVKYFKNQQSRYPEQHQGRPVHREPAENSHRIDGFKNCVAGNQGQEYKKTIEIIADPAIKRVVFDDFFLSKDLMHSLSQFGQPVIGTDPGAKRPSAEHQVNQKYRNHANDQVYHYYFTGQDNLKSCQGIYQMKTQQAGTAQGSFQNLNIEEKRGEKQKIKKQQD
jgi:hypothetical protein